MHSSMNILKITDLNTLKGSIVWQVNYISLEMFKKSIIRGNNVHLVTGGAL